MFRKRKISAFSFLWTFERRKQRGVIYASGQFEPVWTGRLDAVLKKGPTSLSMQVAQDAINGARLAAVADCYYFLYAGSTNRPGVNIGNNLFFPSW